MKGASAMTEETAQRETAPAGDGEAPTVEREAVLPASPDEVWEALTDPDRLEEWLGHDVRMEPVEGGEVRVSDQGGERSGTVEKVVERELLTFTWARPGERESRVEFAVETAPGGSRLIVTESRTGPVGMAGASAARAAAAWEPRLRRLSSVVALVPA